jgi:hypothetical protein
MPTNFGFMGNPIVPGQSQQQSLPQFAGYNNQNLGYVPPAVPQQQPMYPAYIPNTPPPEEPIIKSSPLGLNVTVVKDDEVPSDMILTIPEDTVEVTPAKKRGRPRKGDHPIRPSDADNNTTVEDPARSTVRLPDSIFIQNDDGTYEDEEYGIYGSADKGNLNDIFTNV